VCRPVSLSLSFVVERNQKKEKIEGDKQNKKKRQHSSLKQMQLLNISLFPEFWKGGKKSPKLSMLIGGLLV
jgi:hypothetical protein